MCPCLSKSKLSGLMSRWMKFAACTVSSAKTVCAM